MSTPESMSFTGRELASQATKRPACNRNRRSCARGIEIRQRKPTGRRPWAWQKLPMFLTENPANHLALDKFPRLIQVVVHNRAGIDADAVINSREQVLGVDRVLQRRGGSLIRLAVHQASFGAGPSDAGSVAVWPVVAAIVLVLVAGGADAT